jgi:hypothetical protein
LRNQDSLNQLSNLLVLKVLGEIFGVAEFGYETCKGNPLGVARNVGRVGTGALPLRKNIRAIQQHQIFFNKTVKDSKAFKS